MSALTPHETTSASMCANKHMVHACAHIYIHTEITRLGPYSKRTVSKLPNVAHFFFLLEKREKPVSILFF